jgi:hypothetical protein
MFGRLGQFIGHVSDNPSHTRIAVVMSVLIFGAVEGTVHELIAQLDMPPVSGALIDGILVGGSFGLAVWVLLVGNRERRMRVHEDLKRISELNHEIRNALEVIMHSHFDADAKHRDIVMESVTRIDAVLKRVVPGVGGNKLS